MIKAVIFDLDGTLAATHEDVWDCVGKALSEREIPLPASFINKTNFALTAGEIYLRLVPQAKAEDADSFQQRVKWLYTQENDFSKTTLYPGMLDLLDQLKELQISLFIATMKSTSGTAALLRAAGISDYFKAVLAPDSFGERMEKWEMLKTILDDYALQPQECIMVGDSLSDILAAARLGIPAVGVSWGYGNPRLPEGEGKVLVAARFEELEQQIFNWINDAQLGK